jgi:hypothetical protein
MSPIHLVSAFGLLLAASANAHAASPATAPAAAPVLTGVEGTLPKLELGLSEVGDAPEHGQARAALGGVRTDARAGSRSPSLAQFLNAPAPYSRLLPQPIEDRGIGYRLWF